MHLSTQNNEKFNSRTALRDCFTSLFNAVWRQRSDNVAGILTGNRIPLYGEKTAAFETFSRLLWGVFPLLASGESGDLDIRALFRLIAAGANPAHPCYWGETGDFDQRSVEMAVFGVGLALSESTFRQQLDAQEQQQLFHWLRTLRKARIPQNNWSFFPIMVEMGLCLSGESWSPEVVARHFARLDSFYLGDGWYSDGLNRPRDYYNGMALHFYGLIYAQLMRDIDPQRCRILRERAALFAHDFIHFFSEDGAAIAYGRSMTYRFAQVAFWSAAVFAGLDVFPLGVMKGLIFRHLRHWLAQDITDTRGILTVGYGYANEIMAEEYNAPGSPYWAFKTFLILALKEDHPFWQSAELPLPSRNHRHAIARAGQLIIDDENSGHHYMLNVGQTPGKNYANSESKYAKFAYSSLLGFNLERSRFGLELSACDSMLLLAEQDGHYRGRRTNERSDISDRGIYTRWSPWHDVAIDTWLIPLACGHLRIHLVQNARPLESAEGGFPLPLAAFSPDAFDTQNGTARSPETGLYSRIVDISPALNRACSQIISPPASNIRFPYSSSVPTLKQTLAPGRHLLCCVADAGHTLTTLVLPAITLTSHSIEIKQDDQLMEIPL